MFGLLRECDACHAYEERIFEDSYTGREFCLQCLAPVADQITNSPDSEGDNLDELLPDEDTIGETPLIEAKV